MSLAQTIETDHQRLGQLLWQCQLAIVEKDIVTARRYFVQLMADQKAHIAFENTHVLPLLAQVITPRWAPAVYLKEHDKVEKLLDQFYIHLHGLPSTLSSEQVITSIEALHPLKHVLEHHEEREQKGLLPELERHLTADQLHSLVEHFNAHSQR